MVAVLIHAHPFRLSKVPSLPPASKTSSNVDKRNKKGETQLHIACRLLLENKAKSLLALGADPNTQDFAGWTPLHEVAQASNVALVDMLLEHGANPNVPGGQT